MNPPMPYPSSTQMLLSTKDYQHFQILDEESGHVLHEFDGAKVANRCLPGDKVSFDNGIKLIERAAIPVLVGTIHIQSKYLFGYTSKNVPIYLFHPYDTSYPPMRVGCSSKDGTNKIGLVQFDTWDSSETYPRANLQQVLGDSGDPVAEYEAIQYQYAPWKKQTAKISVIIPTKAREPQLEGFTFNVDPQGCKDIDDVLTLSHRDDGKYNFAITIANLTDAVSPNSPLNFIAARQAQTLYDDGNALVPMLPRWLSEDAGSLLPGKERKGMALKAIWDGTTLNEFRFEECLVKNDKTYSYEEFQAVEGFPRTQVQAIASFLKGKPSEDSHEWVEQCMILYNLKVAELFRQESRGLLRQRQPGEFEAATYVPTVDAGTHADFNTYYTHATSPLRRYTDLLAQRYLQDSMKRNTQPNPSGLLLYHLNKRNKQSKSFERDCFFLKQVSLASSGSVDCEIRDMVLSGDLWKLTLWIPSWNRFVKLRCSGTLSADGLHITRKDQSEIFRVSINDTCQLKYYCDMTQPNWKRRLVLSLTNLNKD
jgi:exoribonuclease R